MTHMIVGNAGFAGAKTAATIVANVNKTDLPLLTD
jgi:hypothetical protein